MAKDLEMGYLLDFYGEVLTAKQREMLRQYYNDDLSLSEIGENFGITRQGARDAIKHGETTLKELEAKVGFAARYRRVQEKLEELEQLVIDTRFECTSPYASLNTTQYAKTLTRMLELIRSIDEVNES
ncbi:MAG: sigma factor-like helix-turn-helix DNA-binding protein [Faecalibacterium sp.]